MRHEQIEEKKASIKGRIEMAALLPLVEIVALQQVVESDPS